MEPVPAPKRIHSGKELLLTKSFDGKKVVSVSVEKNNQSLLKVWDFSKNKDLVDEEKELFEFEEKYKVSNVIFSPDGKKLLTRGLKNGKDILVSIWNINTGKKLFSFNNDQAQSNTFAFNEGELIGIGNVTFDGQYIQNTFKILDASINKEKEVFIYKAKMRFLENKDPLTIPLVFSPDGKKIASFNYVKYDSKSDEDQNPIKIWDTKTGEKILSLDGHGHAIRSLNGRSRNMDQSEHDVVSSFAFSPDGKMLASGSRNGSIKLWEISPPQK